MAHHLKQDYLFSFFFTIIFNALLVKKAFLPVDLSFVFLTKKFFIEAEKNRVLKKPFRYNKPLILIHGLKDNVVKEDVPKKILKKVTGKYVNIIYLKESDHRLSSDTDLTIITQSIEYIRNLKK